MAPESQHKIDSQVSVLADYAQKHLDSLTQSRDIADSKYARSSSQLAAVHEVLERAAKAGMPAKTLDFLRRLENGLAELNLKRQQESGLYHSVFDREVQSPQAGRHASRPGEPARQNKTLNGRADFPQAGIGEPSLNAAANDSIMAAAKVGQLKADLIAASGLGSFVVKELLRRGVLDTPLREGFAYGKPNLQERSWVTGFLSDKQQSLLGLEFLKLTKTDTPKNIEKASSYVHRLYDEMAKVPGAQAVGSYNGGRFAELAGMSWKAGHYFSYTPMGADPKEPLPVLVFLHGAGGNFKSYTWSFRELAEKHKMLVVSPSVGYGNWVKWKGRDLVADVLKDVEKTQAIDRSKVIVAGLSLGAYGAAQVCESSIQCEAMVLISPVIDQARMTSNQFRLAWKDKPILMVSGGADTTVPIDRFFGWAKELTLRELNTTTIAYPDQGHLMLFSEASKLHRDISSWLQRMHK